MSEAEILAKVKDALGITGTYQDKTLNVYINDIKFYLKNAGVDDDVLISEASLGVITRGVADLWNYGDGEGKLSSYFYERVIQLALHSNSTSSSTDLSSIIERLARLEEEFGTVERGEVSKTYVDDQDNTTLVNAKSYTNTKVSAIKVPTKVSELNNDSGYLTTHQDISNLATKSSVDIIEGNVINNSNQVLILGNKINTKQDQLTAGPNITIENNVISSSGGGSSYDDTEIRNLITNKVDKVAGKDLFSGSYTDLTDKPSIPTAYDDTELRGLISANAGAIENKANSSDVYSKSEIDTKLGDIETLLGGI